MRKKILRMLCAVLFTVGLCSSCTESSHFTLSELEIGKVKPAVMVFPSVINASTEGGSYTVTLSANCSWVAATEIPSCRLSPASGNTSEHTLTIEIDPNNSGTPLDGKITVKATNPSGSVETVITITQENQPPAPKPQHGIATLKNLLEFAKAVNDNASLEPWTDPSDGVIKLLADIDMNGVYGWKPIGFQTTATPATPFSGTFDGNGFKIINFTVTQASDDPSWGFALFGYNNGTIRNIVIESGHITSSCTYAAAISARNGTTGVIENCSSGASITSTAKSSYIGGIVGYNQGTITNCNTTGGTITGTSNAAGIAGQNIKAAISGCVNRANINAEKNAGGITTTTSGDLTNCTNYGSITANASKSSAGGIATYIDFKTTVSSCTNYGTILGNGEEAAGVAGYNLGTVTDCINRGNITGNGWYSAGIVAANNNDINGTATHNYGTITGSCDFIGGIVAYNYSDARITDAKNEGIIRSECDDPESFAGGIAGYTSASETSYILRCENSGPVSGPVYFVGGITGQCNLTITACTNSGKVSEGRFTGGIIGRMTSAVEITDCRNQGEVSGVGTINWTGGIVGHTSGGKFIGCSNSGKVTSTGSDAGGISGQGSGTYDNCTNTGLITCQNDAVGGITSRLISGAMKSCSNSGDIVGGGALKYAGGLAGIRNSSVAVTNCTHTGSVNGVRPGPEFGKVN